MKTIGKPLNIVNNNNINIQQWFCVSLKLPVKYCHSAYGKQEVVHTADRKC
jgi:hypothetical protein